MSSTLEENRYLLSGKTRVASERGQVVRLDLEEFAQAERGEIPKPELDEQILLILAWFQRRSTRFGEILRQVSEVDYPVAYCRDPHEWMALIRAAVDKQWLNTDHLGFGVTLAGREKLKADKASAASLPKESNVSNLPKHFARYQAEVDEFMKDGAFEESVFVMMKFPDARLGDGVVQMLDTIFRTVRDELARYGLNARRADDKTYAGSRQLWDNLCVYMLGCKYGLAVLEDRSGEDFNPNVALEYGFMRALGRDAVLVKERTFKYIRADVLATIPKEFSISAKHDVDENSLRDAVESWMVDLGRPAKRRR